MIQIMLANSWTTIVGIVTAISNYLAQVGGKVPTTGAEWAQFAFSLGLAIMGVVAKDATTGSKPT